MYKKQFYGKGREVSTMIDNEFRKRKGEFDV